MNDVGVINCGRALLFRHGSGQWIFNWRRAAISTGCRCWLLAIGFRSGWGLLPVGIHSGRGLLAVGFRPGRGLLGISLCRWLGVALRILLRVARRHRRGPRLPVLLFRR